MNDKGQASLLSLVLIALFVLISLHSVSKRIDRSKELKEKQRLLLCTKAINGKLKTFIKSIELGNKYLKIIKISEYASYLIPQLGITAKLTTKNAIKAIKLLQTKELYSYLNFMRIRLSQGCKFNYSALTTPYQLSALNFKRNKWEQVVQKGKSWTIVTRNASYIIKNRVIMKERRVFSKMKRVKPWQRYLSPPQS